MKLPNQLTKTINFFERLPGIGPKSAKRLGFFLLRLPSRDLEEFANALSTLKSNFQSCPICYCVLSENTCQFCDDISRDNSILTVVEEILDLISFESGTKYKGLYHVLQGRIDPMNYVGPDDLQIFSLLNRLEKNEKISEVILATNPNIEGEATAMYIRKVIFERENLKNRPIKVTRLAYGLPMGAQVEYADYQTLARAIDGRREM